MANVFSYLLYTIIWVLSFLPFWLLYLVSDLFFFNICYVFRYRRKVIDINIKNSFPEKSVKERAKIRIDFYRHLCDMFLETFKLLHVSEEQMRKRCKFNNPDFANDYFDNGQSVVAIMGHYANWEWLSFFPVINNRFKFLPIYKPLHNKVMDRLYIDIRSRFGSEPLAKHDVLRVMLVNKKNKVPTLTGFVGDQTPTRDNIHYWTNFLNQDTPIFIGIEKLAKKLDQPVFFGSVNRIKRGYYEVDLVLITANPKDTDEFYITEKHTRLLENDIIKNPAYWLWSHKRWKHSRLV